MCTGTMVSKFPKKIPKTMIIGNDKGKHNSVSFIGNAINGVW